MTKQAGLSHRYTPEFIFAHEFTLHYDEFAQYIPEFGRLKQLSKVSSLIRVLSSLRQTNKEIIQAPSEKLLRVLIEVKLDPEPAKSGATAEDVCANTIRTLMDAGAVVTNSTCGKNL